MLNDIKFAPIVAQQEVSNELAARLEIGTCSRTLQEWADSALSILDKNAHGLVFKIGALRKSKKDSFMIARRIAELLCDAVRCNGILDDIAVEVDEAQSSQVFGDHAHRTLLPHHDSAHASYLTPSTKFTTDFAPKMRLFSRSGITSKNSHKLYQGIFIADPGEGLSLTSFYDKVAMLERAFRLKNNSVVQSYPALARWCGENVKKCWERREDKNLRYLTIGGAMGLEKPVATDVPVHWAERSFDNDQVRSYPELKSFNEQSRKSATGASQLFFEAVVRDALDLSLQEFREEFELCVPSERYDFVIGQNISNLHGGLLGGQSRLLVPICLVTTDAGSERYENWLSEVWRQGWARLN